LAFIASWDRFFAGCDVFLAPAMPMRAWRADDERLLAIAEAIAAVTGGFQPSPGS
jgi:Asp-tRNA(Asn)/Glu-tRNA(Gln) amidotransferase A subunit family amidase